MIRSIALFLFLSTILCGFTAIGQDKNKSEKTMTGNPVVILKTNMGAIKIELFPDKAPVTVKNFLGYVDEKYYDNTVFHRVMDNFMIQGGGFENSKPIKEKKTKAPIVNESKNGLKNDRGTIAMARKPDPNSATSQFFINVKDNPFLNQGDGYAVFGKVLDGMDVVDKIKKVKTGTSPAIALNGNQEIEMPFADVPAAPVVIESIRRAEGGK